MTRGRDRIRVLSSETDSLLEKVNPFFRHSRITGHVELRIQGSASVGSRSALTSEAIFTRRTHCLQTRARNQRARLAIGVCGVEATIEDRRLPALTQSVSRSERSAGGIRRVGILTPVRPENPAVFHDRSQVKKSSLTPPWESGPFCFLLSVASRLAILRLRRASQLVV